MPTNKNSAQNILNSLDETSEQTNITEKIAPNNVRSLVNDAVQDVDTKPNSNKNDALEKADLTVQNLLFSSAHHYLFAKGNENADWLVIGHSPETYSGIGLEPYAYEAGELLNNMLKAVDIEYPRQQSYWVNICNLNKDRDQNEIETGLLNQQLHSIIKKIQPKIVLIVGQIAAQNLLKTQDPLIIMRSKIHYITDYKIPCVVTYYPDYLLQKTIDKRKAWNDLKLAMSALEDVG